MPGANRYEHRRGIVFSRSSPSPLRAHGVPPDEPSDRAGLETLWRLLEAPTIAGRSSAPDTASRSMTPWPSSSLPLSRAATIDIFRQWQTSPARAPRQEEGEGVRRGREEAAAAEEEALARLRSPVAASQAHSRIDVGCALRKNWPYVRPSRIFAVRVFSS